MSKLFIVNSMISLSDPHVLLTLDHLQYLEQNFGLDLRRLSHRVLDYRSLVRLSFV